MFGQINRKSPPGFPNANQDPGVYAFAATGLALAAEVQRNA
jgi:hypothetical protein